MPEFLLFPNRCPTFMRRFQIGAWYVGGRRTVRLHTQVTKMPPPDHKTKVYLQTFTSSFSRSSSLPRLSPHSNPNSIFLPLDLGVLRTGYKLPKNFMKVLEGFLEIQLDSVVQNCVEVVELFVKMATVTREVSRIVDWTGWKERLKLGEVDGGCSDVAENLTCRFVGSVDFDYGVCLNFERAELDGRHCHGFGDCRYSCLGFGLWEGGLNGEPCSETCLSDLFYLSILVCTEILKHCL